MRISHKKGEKPKGEEQSTKNSRFLRWTFYPQPVKVLLLIHYENDVDSKREKNTGKGRGDDRKTAFAILEVKNTNVLLEKFKEFPCHTDVPSSIRKLVRGLEWNAEVVSNAGSQVL